MNFRKPYYRKYLIGLLVVILCGIVFLGIKTDEFAYTNGVEWLKHHAGIRFRDYGMVHSDPFFKGIGRASFEKSAFSIEIAFRPENLTDNGFRFVFVIHNGSDADQLLMGQWRSNIIIMNGNDYSWKRRTKRLTFDMASLKTKTNLLVLTSGGTGTKLYCNGELVKTKKDLTLKIPDNEKSRLILGNSAGGNAPWRGDLYGFAFYQLALTVSEVAQHHKSWVDYRTFLFASNKNPCALYLFDETEGQQVFDRSGHNQNLKIPIRVPVFEKRFLTAPWIGFKLNRNAVEDVILNIVGFIPLGFVLLAVLAGFDGQNENQSILITVAICFTISLIIEILQAWIPTRTSSVLDVMMNTLGAVIGSILAKLYLPGFRMSR